MTPPIDSLNPADQEALVPADDNPNLGAPHPLDSFLQTFLSYFWIDNTDEEAQAQWTAYVRMAPDQAAAYVTQLEAVLADPPQALGARLYQWAWRSQYDEVSGDWVLFPQSAAVAWLRAMTDDFRAIHAATKPTDI
jgi:hypothetical protein